MDAVVFIVSLIVGALMVLSVCFVYVKHQLIRVGGMSMCAFGVILMGMSVWRSIDVSIDEAGFTAKLDQALEAANEAKNEVAEVREASEKNAQQTIALRTTINAFRVQDALRTRGLYDGALDGQLTPETKASLLEYQGQKNIPTTGQLDPKTLEALNIRPIRTSEMMSGATQFNP